MCLIKTCILVGETIFVKCDDTSFIVLTRRTVGCVDRNIVIEADSVVLVTKVMIGQILLLIMQAQIICTMRRSIRPLPVNAILNYKIRIY